MKTLFKTLVISLGLLATIKNTQAQDIHFSQFFEAPLLRNPSLAGLFDGDLRLQVVYRDQWKSVTPNSFRTASINGEYKMAVSGDDFFTVGAQLLLDKAGSAEHHTYTACCKLS
jgi:hypothetical protein